MFVNWIIILVLKIIRIFTTFYIIYVLFKYFICIVLYMPQIYVTRRKFVKFTKFQQFKRSNLHWLHVTQESSNEQLAPQTHFCNPQKFPQLASRLDGFLWNLEDALRLSAQCAREAKLRVYYLRNSARTIFCIINVHTHALLETPSYPPLPFIFQWTLSYRDNDISL